MTNDPHLDIAVIIFGVISSLIIMIGYFPLTLKLIKSKQTYGISLIFILFITLACFIWVIYGSLLLVDIIPKNPTSKQIEDGLIAALPILITNIVLFILNTINFFTKFLMIYRGKKINMTEKQYCDLYYQQQVEKTKGKK